MMHPEAHAAVDQMLTDAGIPRTSTALRILDLGGADHNGTARDLLPHAQWTGLDIEPGPGVDIVADARDWIPGNDQWFDLVVCTELLEHVEQWQRVLGTAYLALRDRGNLFITCASDGRPEHGARGAAEPAPGEYYGNVSYEELYMQLQAYFRDVTVTFNPNPGDVYARAVK